MAAAETEKSHAGPVSGTVLTAPPVCVIVSAPGNRPGRCSRSRTEADWTIQAAPPGAITIGKLPPLQEAELSVNTPVPAAIAEILSGKLPVLPIETGKGPLVVVSRAPGKVRLVGLKVMLGAFALPVPVSATCIGWAGPSRASTMFRVADAAAATAGVKVTPIVQEAPPASGVVHGVVPLAVPTKSADWCSLAEASSRWDLKCYS